MGSELQEAAFYLEISGFKKKQVWKLDNSGRIGRVSPALEQLTGYSAKELLGKPFKDILTADSWQEVIKIHEVRLAGERDGIRTGTIGIELDVARKEGSVVAAEFLISPELSDDGAIAGFFVFSREISRKYFRSDFIESRDLFDLFMANFPGLAYIKEPDGTTIFANEGFRACLGLDPRTVMGRKTEDLFPPSMAADMIADDKKVFETGEIVFREEDVAGKVWSTRKFPMPGKDGKTLLGGFTYDITERVANQRAVRISEERLRRAEIAAGFGNWEFHLGDGSVFASEGARRIYGVGGSEWTIPNIQKVPLAEYRDMLDRALRGLIRENKPYDVEFVIRRPSDGSLVSIHSIAQYDPEKNTVFGVIQDISARKSAEEALLRKSEELNKFFYTSLDLFCIADREGHFINLNPQWEKTLGYPLESLIGKVFMDYVHPDDRASTRAVLRDLDKNKEVLNFVNRYRCADGSWRWIEWRSLPADGLIYAAARDITERMDHEEALKKARNKAEEADRLKSAFLANISHEIRTPMNGIIGFAEMLKDPDLSETERNEFVQIINDSSLQLLNIVNDVLDISRIEVGEVELHYSDIPVKELLDGLSHVHKALAEKAGLSYQVDFRMADDDFVLYSDPVKLRQVLTNLLGNALKFTQTGSITLGCRTDEPGFVCFSVRDTGPGIPLELQEKIFERFHQLDPGGIKALGGTGLGLSIARALVRLLGGELKLQSVPGQGSEFLFSIPVGCPGAADRPVDTPSPSSAVDGVILVVEDDEMNWQYTLAVLKGSGFRVLRAASGSEAIRLVRMEKPDLVLLDIKLPDINGLEVAAMIRQTDTLLPLVALTAYAFETDRARALAAGCNDYLVKPVRREVLLETIDRFKPR